MKPEMSYMKQLGLFYAEWKFCDSLKRIKKMLAYNSFKTVESSLLRLR